jgi:GPH family glycoside/pentoside/hexuronide:cation symporter
MSGLTFAQRAGYGVGDIGFNLLWTSISLYLLFYYTDVLGISSGVAGAIIMIGMIWDGITDPLMGLLADRTRTRWGRYRPYLLFGAIPLGLSFVLMFATPWFGAGSIVLAVAVSQVLFRTAYTVLAIPFSALSARLTSDSMERNRLSAVRMVCATIGGLFVARFTLDFATQFGDGDLKIGFLKVAILYATLATLIFWTTFAGTKEKEEASNADAPSLKMIGVMLRRNWAFLILFVAVMAGSSGGTIVSKALVYYLIYAVGAEPSAIGEVLAVFIGMITVSVPAWAWVTERRSKRFVWLTGSVISIFALTLFFFAMPTSVGSVMGIMAVHGIGSGAFVLTFWSMLPDTVEFGEWKSGIRGESIVFGLITLSQKVSLGIGVGLLGILLGWIGYVPNEAQSPETLDGLLRIMTIGPAFLILFGAILISFYPIDKELHLKMTREIDAKKAGEKRAQRNDGGIL